MASPAGAKQKVPVTVEVCLKPESSAAPAAVKEAVEAIMKDRSVRYRDGPLQVDWCADEFLSSNVASIVIANTDEHIGPGLTSAGMLLFWQIQLRVMVYQLCEEGAAEDADGEDEMAMYREWALPAREFHHMWEALLYESAIKRRLLKYSASALLFADRHVDTQLVAWNRVVLLHGPPGTGKTSLCKALAQKLAIKFSSRFPQSQLIEVNAHSLFSKWFSESGKLVTKLFSKIGELVEDEESLVFVLIDEVESLTAARNAAVSGTEPSDAIRVVNALLTQIDALKQCPNVLVLTTTNITQAIDLAFVDRADIKVYIGPPNAQARYEILRSCVNELLRAGIIVESPDYELPHHRDLTTSGAGLDATLSPMNLDMNSATSGDSTTAGIVTSQLCGSMLMEISHMCEGFSGRILRKLPFLAHTHLVMDTCSCQEYMQALKEACLLEREDRGSLV